MIFLYFFLWVFFKTPKQIRTIDNNEKIMTLIDSCRKIISPTSTHGMRIIKSLSGNLNFHIYLNKLICLNRYNFITKEGCCW
jgi:hypothetical protein